MSETTSKNGDTIDLASGRSWLGKIWVTFVLLLMSLLMFLSALALGMDVYRQSPWLSFICRCLLETIGLFLVLATVSLWYRPAWLLKAYAKAHFKVAMVYRAAKILFLIVLLYGLYRSLFVEHW